MSGNAAWIKVKGGYFDPAAWWADNEVDIAMTRLFGGLARIL